MFKQIPPVTRNLLFINLIIFMVQQVLISSVNTGLGGDILIDAFGLYYIGSENFRIWQLVTYMFLHSGWMHLLFNMFSLWMFGRIIEQTMGQKKFIIYIFLCGIAAALCQEIWQACHQYAEHTFGDGLISIFTKEGIVVELIDSYLNDVPTIGISGVCYGLLLAFGMTFPEERIMLLIPPIPMKAKYFVIVFAVIELFSAFGTNSNIAHFAHLGGMIFGWLMIRHWRRQAMRPRFTGWGEYARRQPDGSYGTQGRGVMQNISHWVQQIGAGIENTVRQFLALFGGKDNKEKSGTQQQNYRNPDHEYNARKQEEKKHSPMQQARIDEILDKVRRSGYDSLTEQEKRDLFSNN